MAYPWQLSLATILITPGPWPQVTGHQCPAVVTTSDSYPHHHHYPLLPSLPPALRRYGDSLAGGQGQVKQSSAAVNFYSTYYNMTTTGMMVVVGGVRTRLEVNNKISISATLLRIAAMILVMVVIKHYLERRRAVTQPARVTLH